jgi:acetate kinase
MYVDRLVQEIGAAAASLEGCDAIVFSGGIGENSAPIRAMVLKRLSWLGFNATTPMQMRKRDASSNPQTAHDPLHHRQGR